MPDLFINNAYALLAFLVIISTAAVTIPFLLLRESIFHYLHRQAKGVLPAYLTVKILFSAWAIFIAAIAGQSFSIYVELSDAKANIREVSESLNTTTQYNLMYWMSILAFVLAVIFLIHGHRHFKLKLSNNLDLKKIEIQALQQQLAWETNNNPDESFSSFSIHQLRKQRNAHKEDPTYDVFKYFFDTDE